MSLSNLLKSNLADIIIHTAPMLKNSHPKLLKDESLDSAKLIIKRISIHRILNIIESNYAIILSL